MQNMILVAVGLLMFIKLLIDLDKIREEMQRIEKAIRDNDNFLREMQYRAQIAQNNAIWRSEEK